VEKVIKIKRKINKLVIFVFWLTKAYTGPINWITRVYKSANVLVMETPLQTTPTGWIVGRVKETLK